MIADSEEERQIAIDFLALVNQSKGTSDLVQRATAFFQERTGCEAVGIRLREDDDFPYLGHIGFSQQFVQLENKLRPQKKTSGVEQECIGCDLECLCGNVISGPFESNKPFYTARGSFWTNSMSDLIAGAAVDDLPSVFRHRCQREGYESIALFPLIVGSERVGLLQLNDRRKGKFTPHVIPSWEKLRDTWPPRFPDSEPRRRCERINS